MRRLLIHLVVLLVLLLEGHNVLGFASAPGTYPEEETRAGNDMEVPKNPYESTWTGYDFYYEKEPKKVPPSAGSGKMPAFQSIASISTDRESPEDPGNSGYLASGAESGPKKTTSKPATTPTPEPTTTPVEEEKVKVSPSSSTKESQGYEPMGNNGPSIFEGPGTESGYSEPKALSTASQKTKPDDKPYEIPRSIEPSNSKPYPSDSSWSDHDNAPGSEPSYIPDVLDYGARANNHAGKMMNMSHATSPSTGSPSNSNNAISARDPYDHFGTITAPSDIPRANSNFEEYPDDGGYDGTNDVAIVPLRTQHGTNPSTITTTNTQVRAQISEIDRIAESFENSAREPVEYEQRITSESSKGITAVTGKDFMKKLGRKSPTCCSCCDEKQSVSRNIETQADPLHVQHAVDPSRQLVESEPVQNFVPLQNTVGGNAYIQPQPVAQQQTIYQQPFQQYQPQYPQSYQQPSCGCQPQPQNCCAPPAPCCLPTIPCCPPIPCCPQPKICCQPAPVCLPPPTCCSINFKLPTIPICGRACPSCPCRRRMHKSRRLKRHSINSNCHQCSSAGEPWRSVLHHREKRAAPGCTSGFSTMSQNSCGTCGASNLRSPRVKRMGCLPCLGRKKRDTDENSHIRVKRMGCLPCLGRKKRSTLSQSGCSQCNSMGHLFNRYKRSLFGGCSPCAPQQPCGCGRKKRSVTMKLVKRAPMQCDSTCCDFSRCPYRQKKEALVPFM
ncbi:Prion-like-(Q/N-rich)-domain-bearing protein [Caenorhabditis elegans]|uniref:Prion-like-(Q/N-rich)-domain-bearing protein n=1 Tax=Caenorhabditis elegans TaxID=6239 RepID=H2FLI2_CAEEL|nr:Prion-like-(Q/N-rich)-domain-bearing protein [Caenorhabditis elegans]CCF23338.2 Prion-like-(Q/N-rich)-domain-bearing protein [Caenorhabditis elegans]|eukprot:NP_001255651.2 Uncharacterized protein CELE_K08E7.5 [Caenorhabditis elegans]